jgi:hypothetical protein
MMSKLLRWRHSLPPQKAISTSWKIYLESDLIAYIEASWRKIQDPEDGMAGYV